MSDFQQRDAYSFVTLVDRAGVGGTEIIYDGVRLVFPPGEPELTVPRFVAEWIFQAQKHYVWTEDGEYTNRFAIKGAPAKLLEALGEDAGNLSPIAIDGNRLEGWNTDTVDRDPNKLRVIPVNIPTSLMRERQGSSGAYTFGTRKE